MTLDRYSQRAALFLSAAFSPPLVVCYGAVALAPHLGGDLVWAFLIVAVFVFPPVLYVFFLMRRGVVSDFHLTKRGERFRPLKFMVLNTALGMLILSRLGGPTLVIDVVLACLVTLLSVFAVTLYYKISAHSAAVSSLCVLLVLLYGSAGSVFLVCLPLVSWSRSRLSLHTPAQTVAGCLLGVSVTLAVLIIKGRV